MSLKLEDDMNKNRLELFCQKFVDRVSVSPQNFLERRILNSAGEENVRREIFLSHTQNGFDHYGI